MKPAVARKPLIRIAVVESDPLRFVGFRALFDSEPDFELVSATLPEITAERNIDLVLLGSRGGTNLFDQMASLKASRPDLKIIVTGAGIDEETILKAIASGAKGHVDEAGHSHCATRFRLGPAPRPVHVHRARDIFSRPHFSRRPRDFHRPRERSARDAGCGPLQ